MKTKMTEPTKNHPSPSAAPPKRRTFEAELAALNALRDLSPAAAAPEVAQALTLRHNLLVSKAATLALHHHLTSLMPNLVAAFPRFLENSTESDPQCWAKNALAKTLAAFEYQEKELFLRACATSSSNQSGEDRRIPPDTPWDVCLGPRPVPRT
jgi:hypothetical protein